MEPLKEAHCHLFLVFTLKGKRHIGINVNPKLMVQFGLCFQLLCVCSELKYEKPSLVRMARMKCITSLPYFSLYKLRRVLALPPEIFKIPAMSNLAEVICGGTICLPTPYWIW